MLILETIPLETLVVSVVVTVVVGVAVIGLGKFFERRDEEPPELKQKPEAGTERTQDFSKD